MGDTGNTGDEGEALLAAVGGLMLPLLAGLDALRFAQRHLHPTALAPLAEAVAPAAEPLRAGLAGFVGHAWPAPAHDLRDRLGDAATLALRAFDGLAEAAAGGSAGPAYRGFRLHSEACERLWPLAPVSPLVDRFFLDDAARADPAVQAGLEAARGAAWEAAGGEGEAVLHVANARGDRGGWSLYLPPARLPACGPGSGPPRAADPAPLVVALHGGRGHGRLFFWNWLPAARAAGVILAAPTAIGETWALQGEDRDTPNLLRLVGEVAARRPVDRGRMLLTGMSDGGTFCWVSGLPGESPFTHLAPFSASFHPMLLAFADPARLRGLPVHLVHGGLDWMFPPEVARGAAEALAGAGARVTHREIRDLAHAFAADEAPAVLRWFLGP